MWDHNKIIIDNIYSFTLVIEIMKADYEPQTTNKYT